MFTGIITDIGKVRKIETRGDTYMEIETSYDIDTVDIGASICCSGVCLTVVDKGEDWFGVDVSAETLSCTSLGDWTEGTRINLERALKVGDELGGHIVTGHVDALGKVLAVGQEGDSRRIRFSMPEELARFIAPKGSVTINGTSLTVNEVGTDEQGHYFGVNIIPHTQEKTTFGEIAVGDSVNLEIDVLARYVARMNEF
ncbi:riboflavin synthase [Emcibacter nanhaiensis]|uniref:Riboflavin synthase n=1 Tax=Emcibacter nanhaiensis TaxID=1505037 RepID=A0A501PRL1_9PROT|nr:riboflavin synthase [Emcibacter nanhaiensis]TPD62712.1 riboflavin synthase [Emcibacter nanhaiensis]